jgi:hypothetical protein
VPDDPDQVPQDAVGVKAAQEDRVEFGEGRGFEVSGNGRLKWLH